MRSTLFLRVIVVLFCCDDHFGIFALILFSFMFLVRACEVQLGLFDNVCYCDVQVAEKVCDMVLPATYSVFVGGSTLVARDILGVAYCLDITCPQNETVPLTECQISLSDQQVMTSYLICLGSLLNYILYHLVIMVT